MKYLQVQEAHHPDTTADYEAVALSGQPLEITSSEDWLGFPSSMERTMVVGVPKSALRTPERLDVGKGIRSFIGVLVLMVCAIIVLGFGVWFWNIVMGIAS